MRSLCSTQSERSLQVSEGIPEHLIHSCTLSTYHSSTSLPARPIGICSSLCALCLSTSSSSFSPFFFIWNVIYWDITFSPFFFLSPLLFFLLHCRG
ncbi:uncharacterized protein BP01DRAFT_12574 [Aspergillus saccharolyticus JOP 1030-1]|uniref:Uncharacterized protein n=1 Tax=Aspergillus saccharolyticus JOP 1030-1 TaxID=1450539 RepID=A0A318ZQX0_9EURO|nr:hypothetical protein BP01DRAFT_12574 [Aspergillus saccharolyticus JOP 1030-1]PYH50019.1 hypothetical protein BP01DRAFT_12574 [Aspergillus saccharolyticus JOP 1030-1]